MTPERFSDDEIRALGRVVAAYYESPLYDAALCRLSKRAIERIIAHERKCAEAES